MIYIQVNDTNGEAFLAFVSTPSFSFPSGWGFVKVLIEFLGVSNVLSVLLLPCESNHVLVGELSIMSLPAFYETQINLPRFTVQPIYPLKHRLIRRSFCISLSVIQHHQTIDSHDCLCVTICRPHETLISAFNSKTNIW